VNYHKDFEDLNMTVWGFSFEQHYMPVQVEVRHGASVTTLNFTANDAEGLAIALQAAAAFVRNEEWKTL